DKEWILQKIYEIMRLLDELGHAEASMRVSDLIYEFMKKGDERLLEEAERLLEEVE
nr:Chain E, LCB1 [synthetic construct]7JZL_F Chain F, LCB1 [synthetic construct]7JZL_G Chain G, LCB1 [synthetic construct]